MGMPGQPGMGMGMPQRPPMGGMPNPMGGMPNPMGGMPPQMAMPGRMPPQQIPIQLQYLQQSQRLIPGVDKANPNYKAQVGEVIYEYVEKISDENLAPKITGMLIDLPIEDIKAYLGNFNILEEKVK